MINKNEKEIIDIGQLLNENKCYCLEDIKGYELIRESRHDFDPEKGFCDLESILLRQSDNKYFKVEWTDYGKGTDNLSKVKGVEVERKEKIVYVYE